MPPILLGQGSQSFLANTPIDSDLSPQSAVLKTSDEPQPLHLHVSADQLLKHFPQNKIPLSQVHQNLSRAFETQRVIWMHGEDGVAQKTACKQYIDASSSSYFGHIHWINAGEKVDDLISGWKKLGILLNPRWKNAIPDNYPEAFEKHWQNQPYLIVVTNVKIGHFSTLVSFLQHVKGRNHHYIVLSNKQISVESITIDVDQAWLVKQCDAENSGSLGQTFKDIISFSLALSLIRERKTEANELLKKWKSYQKTNPKHSTLRFLLDFLKLKEPQLVEALENLSMLADDPMSREFIDRLAPDVCALLEKYNMIFVENELLTIHLEILQTLRTDQPKNPQNILDLTRQLRGYLDLAFRDPAKEWIIPHIEGFFNVNKKIKDPVVFVKLASMMLDIGHFYTQNGNPVRAQEVTSILRQAIEDYVKKNGKKSSPKDPDKYIEDLKAVHPHLPFLYINCQYQIGRIYFYFKAPHEKMGSVAVLHHAALLCDSLERINKKKPFAAILIQRNGLLFHAMEDKNFSDAIKQYQLLLDTKEICQEVNYKTEELSDLEINQDPQHRKTCLQYLIQAKIEMQESVKEEIVQLREVLERIDPVQKAAALILLAEMYLKQRQPSEALRELESIGYKTLASHQKLIFLRVKMHCCQEDPIQLRETANAYRELAQSYYPEGQRAIYDAWFYENTETFHEQGFDYLKNLDLFIRKTGEKFSLQISSYSLAEGLLTLNLLDSTPENKDRFFQEISLILNSIVKMNRHGHLTLDLNSKEIQNVYMAILDELKKVPQKKNSPPIPPQRKVEQIETKDGIRLSAGNDRQLFIAAPLVDFIKKEGDWNELIKEMEKPGNIDNGSSKYFASQGYRLKMEHDKSGIYKSSSVAASDPELSSEESEETWSDDDHDLEQLEHEVDRFSQEKSKLHAKNQKLLKTPSRHAYFEAENSRQRQVNDDFQKRTKKFKEQVAIKREIPQLMDKLANDFSEAVSSEHSEELKEYAFSYVDGRNTVLEEQGEPTSLKRLTKVERELQALHERRMYLELKQESLMKRRISQQSREKQQYCRSGATIEELTASFNQVQKLPIVREAGPRTLSSRTNSDCQREARRLHFHNSYTFAYHTLKHQTPPPFVYQQGRIVFSPDQFAVNADRYLETTRSLIGREATLICAIPDQREWYTVNHRYLKFTPFSGEINQILLLQRQLEEKKRLIDNLKREKQNNEYSNEDPHKQEVKDLESRLRKQGVENNEISKRLETLCKTSQERKCDFTVVASQETDQAYQVFIRTQFSKAFDIKILPKAQIAPLLNDGTETISIPFYEEKLGKFSEEEIARYLWLDSSAPVSDFVQRVNTVAVYLKNQGFELRGVKADGNCFCSAFLKSLRTLSRKTPILLDAQEDKIGYLRSLIASQYRVVKMGAGLSRAQQIERDKEWLAASGEGDLLAKALGIPIRIVQVSGLRNINDMLTFPEKERESQEWKTLDEKPEEYVLIVDLEGHFICALPTEEGE